MKNVLRTLFLLAAFNFIVKSSVGSDLDIFRELIKASNDTTWCPDALTSEKFYCEDVDFDDDNNHILWINATERNLTFIPESIGSLSQLNSL